MGTPIPLPQASDLLALMVPAAPPERLAQAWERLGRGSPRLLAALRRQGLSPAFYAAVTKTGRADRLDRNFLEALRHDYSWSAKQVLVQEAKTVRVIRALVRAGVVPALLKGADLRLRVYEDPAVRLMADLDFLVAGTAASRAKEVLQALGYRAIDPEPRPGFREKFAHADGYQSPDSGLPLLDLHRDLWGGAGLYRLPGAAVLQETQVASCHGVPVAVLSPEHLILHLCVHPWGDGLALPNFLDLATAVQRLSVNWGEVAADSQTFRMNWPLSQVLAAGHWLAPYLFPDPGSLGLADVRPALMELLVTSPFLAAFHLPLATLARHPFKDWLPFLAAKLWPDQDYIMAVTDSPSRINYFKRFLRRLYRQPERASGNPQAECHRFQG